MIYTINNPKLVNNTFDFEWKEIFTGVVKDKNNTIAYYLNGLFHRKDGPAVELSNGFKSWWINGKRHRECGPAIEWSDGSKEWYVNGKCHREGGPAAEWSKAKEWWLNGEYYGDNNDFTNESWMRLVELELLK